MPAWQHTIPVESRDIPGFPGYRVDIEGYVWSSRGRYKHTRPGMWRRLKQAPFSNGKAYRQAHLCRDDGTTANRGIHNLVLEVFVGPCPPGMMARHLDGNPSNNRLGNLAWGTAQDNAADRTRHGRTCRGERHHSARLSPADVMEIRRMKSLGLRTADLARRFGVDWGTIARAARGETWSHV